MLTDMNTKNIMEDKGIESLVRDVNKIEVMLQTLGNEQEVLAGATKSKKRKIEMEDLRPLAMTAHAAALKDFKESGESGSFAESEFCMLAVEKAIKSAYEAVRLYPIYIHTSGFPIKTAAGERFTEENVKLIHKVAHNFNGYEYDDVFQEAAIGFCKGLANYDPAKGVKLVTFCFRCATNEAKMYVRKQQGKKKMHQRQSTVSYDAAIGSSEDGSTHEDRNFFAQLAGEGGDLGLDNTAYMRELAAASMEIAEEALSDEERQAFFMFYEGHQKEEISATLDTTVSNVTQLIKLARVKIALGLKSQGLIKSVSSYL